MKIIEGDFAQFPPVLPDESCPTPDGECSIESQVWEDLQAEVTQGWRSPDEAYSMFYAWREERLANLGGGVLKAG